MVVTKIQEHLARYKKWLQGLREHPHGFWWETQQQFQAHWQPDESDWPAAYDRSLNNSANRHLWQKDQWQPKRALLLLGRFDPVTLRAMFDDLFNETRDIEARIGRFLFGCDTLLAEYKQAHPTSVENNHYHDDYRMLALYLAGRYPELYAAPYDFQIFQQALIHLGARDIPQINDLGRFFKAHRTLYTFIEKDPAIANILRSKLHPTRHFTGKSMMLAADFTHFVGREG